MVASVACERTFGAVEKDWGVMEILVLLSTAGGGDRQPVIALAVALRDRGHHVTVLCDSASTGLVEVAGLEAVTHEVEQVGFISKWIGQLADDDRPPNPLMEWAELAHAAVRDTVATRSPDVIISSLFCMGLAELLAAQAGAPWCLVNPSFYFGDHALTAWEDDWYGPFVPRLARECFAPLVERADLVLHATDPIFDHVPPQLPASHHYVGFLLWEPPHSNPAFLSDPGDPWALVTASTARPADEETMLNAAVAALADRAVRIVLTLPKHDVDGTAFPDAAVVTGNAPHSPILKVSAISVNQAGHGIVSKCLTYGVPMVLLPWDADQPGVAERAEALGVAAVVARADVSHDTVGTAVAAVLDDPRYTAAAREAAAVLTTRTPESTASALIEQL